MPTALDTPDQEPDDRMTTMRELCRRFILARFGVLPAPLDERIAQAGSTFLETLLHRAIEVERVEEI